MGNVIFLEADINRLEGIRQFIIDNLSAELIVREIAQRFQIGESTLRRHFFAYNKISVSQFVLQCRMEHAMKLISAHSLNINQIGTLVGYNELSSFTRAFTKYYGHSPKYYLKGPKA